MGKNSFFNGWPRKRFSSSSTPKYWLFATFFFFWVSLKLNQHELVRLHSKFVRQPFTRKMYFLSGETPVISRTRSWRTVCTVHKTHFQTLFKYTLKLHIVMHNTSIHNVINSRMYGKVKKFSLQMAIKIFFKLWFKRSGRALW